jgi:hybrid cluster-associated redox disulfide protein
LAGRHGPVVVAAQRAPARGLLNLGQYKNATLEAIMPVESTQLVDDVMRQWPATIRVFLNHKMRCVGCPIACFHTVDDACREHGTDREWFLADLRAASAGQPASAKAEPELIAARLPAGP